MIVDEGRLQKAKQNFLLCLSYLVIIAAGSWYVVGKGFAFS